jgi:hypothetical protein
MSRLLADKEDNCPRCGGLCRERSTSFEHYCAACDLAWTITPNGEVSVAWTILGDMADEMEWIKRLAEKYPNPPRPPRSTPNL